MANPVLIDTDMGVDDAVAVALALASPAVELAGLCSVAGNVSLEQATANLGRLLAGLEVRSRPRMGRGRSQSSDDLQDAAHVFSGDGLGGVDLPAPGGIEHEEMLDLYSGLIKAHGSALTIVAIGPLTNLAAVLRERPGLLQHAGAIVVMGGAIWRKGNVTPHAEFNFYRDPGAAAAVLNSGLPITVVPLDVTQQAVMDESHVARLASSGRRAGELLARMIRFPLAAGDDAGPGRFLVHDAMALGVVLWPELFLRARMGLEITALGPEAGRSRPKVVKDKTRQIGVVMSVQAGEFIENLLEVLCREEFVV